MNRIYSKFLFLIIVSIFSCTAQNEQQANLNNLYPWCIVAFDSLERSPVQRIDMLKELGFSKYAYDWRDKHLDEMETELKLSIDNDIEIISVWFWLNAKRDSLHKLSASNERILEILKKMQLKTTLWVSFNNNFFKNLSQKQSLEKAKSMINFIHAKAKAIDCKVALYNHRDWFGNPENQVEIIKALPECDLSMVFNFHHAQKYIQDFPDIAKKIKPYLSAVNLNGMRKEGPKILPIGEGDFESEMYDLLINEGYKGPWGILGHVENKDVKQVLEKNIVGFIKIKGS